MSQNSRLTPQIMPQSTVRRMGRTHGWFPTMRVCPPEPINQSTFPMFSIFHPMPFCRLWHCVLLSGRRNKTTKMRDGETISFFAAPLPADARFRRFFGFAQRHVERRVTNAFFRDDAGDVPRWRHVKRRVVPVTTTRVHTSQDDVSQDVSQDMSQDVRQSTTTRPAARGEATHTGHPSGAMRTPPTQVTSSSPRSSMGMLAPDGNVKSMVDVGTTGYTGTPFSLATTDSWQQHTRRQGGAVSGSAAARNAQKEKEKKNRSHFVRANLVGHVSAGPG